MSDQSTQTKDEAQKSSSKSSEKETPVVRIETPEERVARTAGDVGIVNPEEYDKEPVAPDSHDLGAGVSEGGNADTPNAAKGSAEEPVGPEDAFGAGPKRGDYSERTDAGKAHYEAQAVPDAKPGEPSSVLINQNARVDQTGNPDKDEKGGVSGPAHEKALKGEVAKAAKASK